MTERLEEVIARLRDLARLPEGEQQRIATLLAAELDKVAGAPQPNGTRIPGLGEGTFETPEDFDEPLPNEFWFGGK